MRLTKRNVKISRIGCGIRSGASSVMFDIHAIKAAAYSVVVDGTGFRFRDANAAALALTGIVETFHPGMTPQDIFPAEVAAELTERYHACCCGEAVNFASCTMVGGELRRWHTTLFSVAGGAGTPPIVYGICNPLAAEPPAALSTLTLEALDDGFWTLDLTTREFRTSRRLAEKIAGPGHLELNLAEYISHVHADDLRIDLPDGDHDVNVEFRVFTFEGRLRWLQTRRRPVRDASGRATHVVGFVLDITERKSEMMRLESEAATDLLTRVGSRRAFERAAARCFDDDARPRFGVLVIDLDGFKPVNDRYGHRVGDDLLQEVGRRLAQLVAPAELLARIGGDEFAVLLPAATPERVALLSRQVEVALFEPFRIGAIAIAIGASCGSAKREACDRSVGDIVARADRALYAVKDQRRRVPA